MKDQENPPITGARPLFPEEDLPGILDAIRDVLRGGRLILGPRTRGLEADWAARIGTKHAVALSSCSAALEIAMRHYGVRGREVIVPTNTFVATVHAAVNAGAKVRFADMDRRDYCVDVDHAIALLGPQTAAVCVVHISGFVPHGFEKLRAACAERGVPIIEDCAHSHGATLAGRATGALGSAGCFSLYPTKILTSGVGGVLTTDDAALADFARSLRHHGQGPSLEEIVNAGNDWLMDEVRAVLAHAQLRRLDEFLATRRAIAAVYDELLAGDPRFVLPVRAPATAPAYYKYPLLLPEGTDREAVRRRLHEEHAIEAGALYSPPTHLMPVFRNALGTGPGLLPVAESLLPRQICLPMHAALTRADATRAVAALRSVLERGS